MLKSSGLFLVMDIYVGQYCWNESLAVFLMLVFSEAAAQQRHQPRSGE